MSFKNIFSSQGKKSFRTILSTGSTAGTHSVTPAGGHTVVTSPTMRVVSSNASTISLITQAASEASGGRQIVTVPAGHAGLSGAKGPVQITITPANRGGINTITLPSNLRQIAKPVVVNTAAANGSQVVSLGGSNTAQVVTVTQPMTGSGDQAHSAISTEAESAGDGTTQASEADGAIQQFDGPSDDLTLDGEEESCQTSLMLAMSEVNYVEASVHFVDHMYADVSDSFVLPQFDGTDDGGVDEEGDNQEHAAEQDAATEQAGEGQPEQDPAENEGVSEGAGMEEGLHADVGHLEPSLDGQVLSYINY